MNATRRAQVLVILCVLVLGSSAVAAGNGTACNIVVDANQPTLNCSRRDLVEISDWTQQLVNIDEDDHLIVTFFNNRIQNITRLPPAPGARIAINFKNNSIIEIESGAFSNLKQLYFLDLSNNRLTGEVLRSEIFQGAYQDGKYNDIALGRLYLSYNEIHSLDKDLFMFTPNLTELYLNNNPIEILDHVTVLALSSAVNLEILDLSYTSIESISDDTFRGMMKLREIDLSGNNFVTVPESLSLVGKTLEHLTINNNRLVELNDDSFAKLSNLKTLQVGDNDYLMDVRSSTFTPLKNLKELHLCHNPILSYISNNAFRGMKNNWTLKKVYIDNNDLVELPVDLMPWGKLETIAMNGNKWLCNCDLYNIVHVQGAGDKFEDYDNPLCDRPNVLRGEYIRNVTPSNCPTFDNAPDKKPFIAKMKPKHVLWSIFGVASVVCIGLVIGLLANAVKAMYKKHFVDQPPRYVNLNSESSFA